MTWRLTLRTKLESRLENACWRASTSPSRVTLSPTDQIQTTVRWNRASICLLKMDGPKAMHNVIRTWITSVSKQRLESYQIMLLMSPPTTWTNSTMSTFKVGSSILKYLLLMVRSTQITEIWRVWSVFVWTVKSNLIV
jgi:hypothetical protein